MDPDKGLRLEHWVTQYFYVGKKRFFLVGLMVGLASPPISCIFFFLLAFTLLFLRIWFCSSPVQAWRCGWWWAFGFHLSTFYWISNSLLVDAKRFAWLLPFCGLGLPAILACCEATILGILVWMKKKLEFRPWEYGLCLTMLWSLLEYVAYLPCVSFPWPLIAYAWVPAGPISQSVSLWGCHGLSLITLLSSSCFGVFLLYHFSKRSFLQALGINVSVFGLLFGLGQWRLHQTEIAFHRGICLRLVQSNIAEKEFLAGYSTKSWQTLLNLSQKVPVSSHIPSHLIWPEGAFPWHLHEDQFPLVSLPQITIPLLTGASYFTRDDRLFNGLSMIQEGIGFRALYAKGLLVPFGEYFPYRSWFSSFLPSTWLRRITPGEQDYSPGPASFFTECPGLPPFRTLICYEAVFPGKIRPPKNHPQPQWILTITDDGWFGRSFGPYQHFATARFRAIEEGLPLVRVANIGISAIIDPLGRVLHSLPLGTQDILDGKLPKAIPLTLYSQYGNSLWAGMMLMGILLLVISRMARLGSKTTASRSIF